MHCWLELFFSFPFIFFPSAAVAEEGGRIPPWEFHQGLSPWTVLVSVIDAVVAVMLLLPLFLSLFVPERKAGGFSIYSYASCDD